VTALEWYEATRLDGTKGQAANVPTAVLLQLREESRLTRFFVARHGEGRKYWEVTYPDGTYTHNALTQAEAKQQAESWQPDPELVQLVDDVSDETDSAPAAASSASVVPDVTAAAIIHAIVDAAAAQQRNWNRGGYSMNYIGRQQQDSLTAISELVALRAAIDDDIRRLVGLARTNTSGSHWNTNAATWVDVGAALGVTKQSAQSKYGGA
jgi:hypothetical protein